MSETLAFVPGVGRPRVTTFLSLASGIGIAIGILPLLLNTSCALGPSRRFAALSFVRFHCLLRHDHNSGGDDMLPNVPVDAGQSASTSFEIVTGTQ